MFIRELRTQLWKFSFDATPEALTSILWKVPYHKFEVIIPLLIKETVFNNRILNYLIIDQVQQVELNLSVYL